jgi:hypothetical protein
LVIKIASRNRCYDFNLERRIRKTNDAPGQVCRAVPPHGHLQPGW